MKKFFAVLMLAAAGYELKTAARRMEQLYDKLGGRA